VYKHFASKQALLDALIELADAHLGSVAARVGTTITAGADAASTYQGVGEESLLAIARGMLDVVLHDPQFALLRRLLTVEQYREADAATRYHDYFITRPLSFQTELFRSLIATGDFRARDWIPNRSLWPSSGRSTCSSDSQSATSSEPTRSCPAISDTSGTRT